MRWGRGKKDSIRHSNGLLQTKGLYCLGPAVLCASRAGKQPRCREAAAVGRGASHANMQYGHYGE